jgi:hypothetical protein
MASNVTFGGYPAGELPPLRPAPEPAAEAPTKSSGSPLMAIGAVVALVVTVAGLGWGFTQWSSAKSWKHRSQKVEAQFSSLSSRTETAERSRVAAQRNAAHYHKALVASETRVAQLANQRAQFEDMRVVICETNRDYFPDSIRAQVCK